MASISKASLLKEKGIVLNDDFLILNKSTEDRAYYVFHQYLEVINPKSVILLDSRIRSDSLAADEQTKYNSIDDLIKTQDVGNIVLIPLENMKVGNSLSSIPLTNESTVAVDISTMNFWELSDLLFYLVKIAQVAQIDFFYTEPDLYHYENDNISEYNHIQPIVSVHYAQSYYSTKTVDEEILVSILGFQKNVNKLLKDLFEVSQYYSINGFPSFYPKAKDISLVNNSDYLSEIHPSNKYSAEAVNPFLTYNTLIDIRRASQNAFMNICPLCSKPMVLGACIFALKYPSTTRIVYPYPERITTKTDGIGQTYCYHISQDFFADE